MSKVRRFSKSLFLLILLSACYRLKAFLSTVGFRKEKYSLPLS